MDDGRKTDYSILLARVSALALSIVLGTGMGALVAGYLIIQTGAAAYPENSLVRNILFLAALTDLAAIQFVKRYYISRLRNDINTGEVAYQALLTPTLVMAGLCSAISVYGLVAAALGSPMDVLLLFVAVSLIGIQLFRIRNRDLESLER